MQRIRNPGAAVAVAAALTAFGAIGTSGDVLAGPSVKHAADAGRAARQEVPSAVEDVRHRHCWRDRFGRVFCSRAHAYPYYGYHYSWPVRPRHVVPHYYGFYAPHWRRWY